MERPFSAFNFAVELSVPGVSDGSSAPRSRSATGSR
jgi:hypothetical protein